MPKHMLVANATVSMPICIFTLHSISFKEINILRHIVNIFSEILTKSG